MEEMAAGSDKLIGKLERALLYGEQLPDKLQKAASKAHKKLLKETQQQIKDLNRLTKSQEANTKAGIDKIKTQQEQIVSNKYLLSTYDKLNLSAKTQTSLTQKLKSKFLEMVDVSYLLSKAWQFLTKAFDTWQNLQRKWAETMGKIAQQTGASAAQMQNLRGTVQGLRTTFSGLEGDVDGIRLAGEFTGELAVAFRQVNQITPQFARGMLEVSRGFGVGAQGAVDLYRTISMGATGAATSVTDFGAQMIRFAGSIGANAATLTKDFIDARASVSQFGSQGQETFRRAALMANHFGFETKKIFDMMKGFDTFQQASENVNQLNAMMGTSLSSFELMMEQDPTKRLEMIRGQIMATGQTWNRMDRFQRMAIARTLGVEEDVAARLFQENKTFEDLEQERRQAAERQQRDAEMQRSNQQMMNSLLHRTTVIFEDLGRQLEQTWNILAEAFAPIFGDLNRDMVGLARQFNAWLSKITKTKEFQNTIKKIANSLQEAFKYLKDNLPTWEQFKQKVQEVWREAKPFVEGLWTFMKWLAEHPTVLTAIFVGLTVAKFAPLISAFGQMASFIGPGGSLLAGAGSLAGILAGLAGPAAGLVAAFAAAEAIESSRISQGQALHSRDTTTRNVARADLAQEAIRIAQERRESFESGDQQEAFGGSGESYLLNAREAFTGLSGQGADLIRGDIMGVINAIAQDPTASAIGAARTIRQSLGSQMASQVERMQHKSIEQIINDLRSRDPAFAAQRASSPNAASAISPTPDTGAATSATATAPTTAATVGASTGAGNYSRNVELVPVTGEVRLDSNALVGAFTVRSVSGR